MLAMLAPVLARLDADDRFRKALVLAIPFAANIGGIGTPVGTPPNAITLGILADEGIKIHFLDWARMAMPLVVILLFIVSGVLYTMFRPKHKKIPALPIPDEKLDSRSKMVLGIGLLTILLWLTSGWHGIPEAIVSLFSVALFAAFGLLDRDDINSIHWDILILMWGGLALGKAMEMSRLGEWVIGLPIFSHEGFWLVTTFCLLTVFVSIFISNTPTANLIVPLAMSIPGADKTLLGVVVALSCSFDMLLPISTPSNALAFSTRVISVKDMLTSGLVIVVIAVGFILLGYPYFIAPISGAVATP
jgi:sodium-dependent dicarboxylate transporter 2/3/5